MQKIKTEYLIDTDVLEEHLIGGLKGEGSYLEALLQSGICFSTVLNAAELLRKAYSEREENLILNVLSALKILGLHARYSLLIPKYSKRVKNINDALFCVVADFNKLPIVTLNKVKYRNSNLTILHPRQIK